MTVDCEDLVVNRWRRYGKDRLYVETSDGAKVGFWDLATDTGHPECLEHESALLVAVADWKAHAEIEGRVEGRSRLRPAPVTPEGVSSGSALAAPAAPERSAVPRAALQDVGVPSESIPSASDGSPPSSPGHDPERMGEPVRPWVDLAANRPGGEAREQARLARDAAPVKTVFARVLGVHTEERAWRIGADGEEKVAAQLAKVARKVPLWRFLHAVPVGNRGSDIDHVIIGPGGVFTANAKHHPGAKIWVGGSTFMVSGTKQPYVRNARYEAERAARLLTDACGFPVHVEGLIVTVNAADVVVKSQPEGVSVVPRMQVADWLLRHGDIHTPDVIDAIFESARRSTTWQ